MVQDAGPGAVTGILARALDRAVAAVLARCHERVGRAAGRDAVAILDHVAGAVGGAAFGARGGGGVRAVPAPVAEIIGARQAVVRARGRAVAVVRGAGPGAVTGIGCAALRGRGIAARSSSCCVRIAADTGPGVTGSNGVTRVECGTGDAATQVGADTDRQREVLGGGGGTGVRGTGAIAHPALRERRPDLAVVGTGIQVGVGIQDRVARFEEGGVASLEFHPVDHQLEREVVSAGARVEIRIPAVLVDQFPVHLPERGCPEGAPSVNPTQRSEVAEGERIDRQVGGVRVRPDSWARGWLSEDVGADSSRIGALRAGLRGEHEAKEVTPALAHAPALGVVEAVDVGGPPGQSVGNAVRVLVGDDAIVE